MKSTVLLICFAATVAILPVAESQSEELRKAGTPTVDPMCGKAAGEARDDNGLKMKFVWCPPGEFVMGDFNDDDVVKDKDGNPKPDVTKPVGARLTRGFWLGAYEIKQSEWFQIMSSQPWRGKARVKEGADFPASYISFDDATTFCRQLTEKERQAGRLPNGWEYTLPTEARWECGCRAGSETRYCFGGDESMLDEYAWSFSNAILTNEEYGHRVGLKKANSWGVYDMHGNVCEWCRDHYAVTLTGGRDPEVRDGGSYRRSEGGPYRVIRGGSYHEVLPRCRSGMRQPGEPEFRGPHLGFRVALGAVQPVK
jgi:formylglycine-generating enzyme required for sulfatase activity